MLASDVWIEQLAILSHEDAPFDRSHTTFYWSAIENIALSCTVFELFDVE